ncbi:MAG: hypothetical protein VX278_15510 [Myxococcota bacterium]|nr:hypothetical protein [Myxococcota bacterium]
MDSQEKLDEILKELQENGVEVQEVAHIQTLLRATHRPLKQKVVDAFKSNWSRITGEVKESRRLTTLLKKGVKNLTPEERHEVQEQLKDFFRVVPAGIFASVNAILPIPGTGLLTPWALRKMGLLPSRWREAHILKVLQDTHKKTTKEGLDNLAKKISTLEKTIETEADLRAEIGDLLLIWDKNENGQWDCEEKMDYRNEIEKTASIAEKEAHVRNWYLLQEGMVFGPFALNEASLQNVDPLVRYGQQTEWVRLHDLRKYRRSPKDFTIHLDE